MGVSTGGGEGGTTGGGGQEFLKVGGGRGCMKDNLGLKKAQGVIFHQIYYKWWNVHVILIKNYAFSINFF